MMLSLTMIPKLVLFMRLKEKTKGSKTFSATFMLLSDNLQSVLLKSIFKKILNSINFLILPEIKYLKLFVIISILQ